MTETLPQVSKQGDATIITLRRIHDGFDDGLLAELTKLILDVIDTANPPNVVIDMSQTTVFTSSFIGVLTHCYQQMKTREGGRFVISGLTSFAKDIFSVTKLHRVFDIYPTREDAFRALSHTF